LRILIALLAVLLWAGSVHAQTAPPVGVAYDLRTARLQWTYDVNEPVTEFRVKCGPTKGGPYSLVASIPNPLARSFPIRGVISVQGDYACVATALNKTLESKVSNEVFFSAEASALTPGNFSIKHEGEQ
jgi:hypothetical protein